MYQRDDFHFIKEHSIDDAIRRYVNLPDIQIQCFMHGMSRLWMMRQNVRSLDDSSHHSISIE